MSSTLDLSSAEWVKSSYSSGEGGMCVDWAPKVAAAGGIVPIRDSKNPAGPTLSLPPRAWSSFITALAEDRISTR
ncbi:DUF397 domain-containing protein [Streptomyces olivoreticuli]|uniref:DUF397 domain-containing protein n=1 Tax=Streptomyces olivoreticuli TaxID=68246 RepID=UPI002659E175|nr:DUF397 domain-containing protein [Streptomyces olivoreticuli]WKK21650.1 DUF397 domain-containing protein [Streptomyces olivoreticuli]